MFAKPLEQLGKSDIFIAGGKGASLGELAKIKIPVPKGFVILAPTFENFLRENGLDMKIESLLRKVNLKDINAVNRISRRIKNLIMGGEFPKDIAEEIKEEFAGLKTDYVAVRSSATAEDSSKASWAGQLESYLNTAKKDLLVNVKKCWASLFAPRAIFYRFEKKLQNKKISVAVVVQKMLNPEVAGVCFTAHPITKNKNQMVIEAVFGLGESLAQGAITPDTYILGKNKLDIINKNISGRKKKKLSDQQIKKIAGLCLKIEKYCKKPQDIEWALEKGKFFILQSRPITTL